MITDNKIDLLGTLKSVFGYDKFRGNQEPVITNLIDGKNTFVIMPTGAGKSMCYQLPALVLDGVAIVISPLIALMKNQVDQLVGFGISAEFLNSTLSKSEANRVKKETLEGKVRMLYVAPESLTKEDNVDFLKRANISFAAIDEAHCISEWGHDFRPEYRRIKSIIEQLGDIPVIALTATATPKVQLDIQKNLDMDTAVVFKSSFNRTNLYYEVRPKSNTKKQLIQYVKKQKGACGIIYCLSRKKTEEIAELLNVNGISALPYHAGLEGGVRMKNQDAFLKDDVSVICATIAFGMGIDKPDVRFIVHYDTPKSIEGYYQETGRAGRDGLDGYCLMFYSLNDITKLEKFNKDKPVTEKENAKLLLDEMVFFAESTLCRRKQLLHYFGEEYSDSCGNCDNCKHPKDKFEAQDKVSLALNTALQTEERFGMNHLIDVVRGSANRYVKSYKHDELDTYSKGKNEDNDYWKSIFRQVLINGYLEKDIENYGILKLTEKGRKFIDEPRSIMLCVDHVYENIAPEDEEKEETMQGAGFDSALFKVLKELRKAESEKKDLPPYVLFQDPSLMEMATTYPQSEEELANISGVGAGKVRKFGAPFIDTIKKYVEENEIATAADFVLKTSGTRSKNKIHIIQMVDKRFFLDEIAEKLRMNIYEVLEELEHITNSGTSLNLDYYIEETIDAEKEDDIYDYFLNAETDDIPSAMKELGDGYCSEEEVRLIRMKFMSELAN